MAKMFEKIEEITCYGDKWHNETLDLLFGGVDQRGKPYKRVKAVLDEVYKDYTKRWTGIPLSYARKLNGIMKSKTEATFQKRLVKYIHFLTYSTHYGALFNRHEIEGLLTLVKA